MSVKAKYIGDICEEETLKIGVDKYKNIYICQDNFCDDLKVGDTMEIDEWLLSLGKKSLEKILKMVKKNTH